MQIPGRISAPVSSGGLKRGHLVVVVRECRYPNFGVFLRGTAQEKDLDLLKKINFILQFKNLSEILNGFK